MGDLVGLMVTLDAGERRFLAASLFAVLDGKNDTPEEKKVMLEMSKRLVAKLGVQAEFDDLTAAWRRHCAGRN